MIPKYSNFRDLGIVFNDMKFIISNIIYRCFITSNSHYIVIILYNKTYITNIRPLREYC